MKINDLSADAFAKLKAEGYETDQDLLDATQDELSALELPTPDLANCLLIRLELSQSLGGGGAIKVPEEVPDDAREDFTVRLLPRHAQWINDCVAANMAHDASHAIEQCVRAAMTNDVDRVGRRAGGTVKADDFDEG